MMEKLMASCISEKPGLEVAVMALAPAQEAESREDDDFHDGQTEPNPASAGHP